MLDERALLEEVVGDYRIPPATDCSFYCRGDADIYLVCTAAERFFLKVYRPPRVLARAEAEARFVEGLAAQGVPVVRVVPRTDGTFATEVTAPEGPRPMLLFAEAPPDEVAFDRPEECREVGRAVAELHAAADALDPPPDLITHDCDRVLSAHLPYAQRLLPADEYRYLVDVLGRIRGRLTDLSTGPPDFGPCHSDLVPSNLRRDADGRITFFDFGNAARTWRAWELGLVHVRLKEDPAGQESLLAGYGEVRALPAGFGERRPLFLLLRKVAWLAGVLASCPLRLGVQDFGAGFADGVLAGIRALDAEIGWGGEP